MNPDHRAIRVAISHLPGASALGLQPADPANLARNPLIDIHEEADGLILEADVPGATEQGLSVQLEDNVLTLHATVEPALPESARPLLEESRPGAFARSFILSDEVDRARITAELKHGVLRINLPKAD